MTGLVNEPVVLPACAVIPALADQLQVAAESLEPAGYAQR
jgi:hypothetical protein